MFGPITDPFSHPLQMDHLQVLILAPAQPCLQLRWFLRGDGLHGQIKAQSITSMH